MQDTQVPAGRNDVHNALFKVRGGHHFKILGRDEFRRGPVQGPVHHHRAAEGGDAITPEGALQRVVETVGPGRAAGIVMLEYCSRGAPGEVLQDIRRIVHVGQIRLAGMLARLDHLALGQGGNNALPRLAPALPGHLAFSFHQLIQGRRLIRVFPVAQSAHFTAHVPYALAVFQYRFPKGDGHGIGETVRHNLAVHRFEVAHAITPGSGGRRVKWGRDPHLYHKAPARAISICRRHAMAL